MVTSTQLLCLLQKARIDALNNPARLSIVTYLELAYESSLRNEHTQVTTPIPPLPTLEENARLIHAGLNYDTIGVSHEI